MRCAHERAAAGVRCLRASAAASRAASFKAATRLDGSALPVPAMSKAVPWSGEVRTNGRPSVTLTAVVEGQRLDRDQRLVVIHAERRRRRSCAPPRGTWCRRRAARARRCRRRQAARSRACTIRLSSLPSVPSSPACGLRPATASRGCAIPKRSAISRATTRPVSKIRSRVSCCGTSLNGMWMVTGTTATSGAPQHHHRPGRIAGLPRTTAARDIRCGRDRRSPPCRARSWRPDWSRPPHACPAITSATARSIEAMAAGALLASGLPGSAVAVMPSGTTGRARAKIAARARRRRDLDRDIEAEMLGAALQALPDRRGHRTAAGSSSARRVPGRKRDVGADARGLAECQSQGIGSGCAIAIGVRLLVYSIMAWLRSSLR